MARLPEGFHSHAQLVEATLQIEKGLLEVTMGPLLSKHIGDCCGRVESHFSQLASRHYTDTM